MIAVTVAQGFLVMIKFLCYPQGLAPALVPTKIRHTSITHVRLSSVQFITSVVKDNLVNVGTGQPQCAIDHQLEQIRDQPSGGPAIHLAIPF